MHYASARGAKSCMARLSSEVGPVDDSTRRPRSVHFFSEPTHRLNSSLCESKDEDATCTSQSSIASRSTGASDESPQIVLQILPQSAQLHEKVGVELSNMFDDGSGCVCIDLTIVIGETSASDNLYSLGQLIPVSLPAFHHEPHISRSSLSCLSDASTFAAADSTKDTAGDRTPDMDARSATTDDAVLSKPKSSMVCRHWKHGWCKYEDKCRFLHPSDKKGANGPSNNATEIGLPSRSQRKKHRAANTGVQSTFAVLLPVGAVQNSL